MSDFLNNMARTSRDRADAVTRTFKSSDLDRPAHPLRLSGFDLIAELKDRSPAEGELSANSGNRIERARHYVAGGAAAISVLTEPERFDGALSHLAEVVAAGSGDDMAAEIITAADTNTAIATPPSRPRRIHRANGESACCFGCRGVWGFVSIN